LTLRAVLLAFAGAGEEHVEAMKRVRTASWLASMVTVVPWREALEFWAPCTALLLGACDTTNNTYVEINEAPGADAGTRGGTPVAPDAGADALSGAPVPDVAPDALELDVLGTVGNHYWFAVSEEQLNKMNNALSGGSFDLYSPTSANANAHFVDHLLVQAAGPSPHAADFGKVQVKLVGQSTARQWTESALPNFKLDADEFVKDRRIGGIEHLRLNNAIYGSIFRERLVFDIYRAVGYPAPRSTYAWVSTSVWGPDVSVPYIAVESYKRQFCRDRQAELGGGCINMWEFAGDFGQGVIDLPDSCQLEECDNTRVRELEELVAATPPGAGFKAALEAYVDWDAFHRFQCLSWILRTGDDYIHSLNNVLLVERTDGKFQFMPYSIDLSLSPDFGPSGLAGYSSIPAGCQSDPACWADTVATCEVMIDAFTSTQPVTRLDGIYAELEQAGMLRSVDEGIYRSLRGVLEERIENLPAELELNRELPETQCPLPLVPCGNDCLFPDECPICPPSSPVPEAPDAGVPAADVPGIPPPDDGAACIPAELLYERSFLR
jgi:hypothetical protein